MSQRTLLKCRLLSITLLLVVSTSFFGIPEAKANYRLVSNATDSWPSVSNQYALVNGLKISDADADGTVELLAGGTFYNGTSLAELRIYHKSSGALVLEGSQLWPRPAGFSTSNVYLSAVEVGDVDGDGLTETVLVGNSVETNPMSPKSSSHLGIYRWTGSSLVKERLYNFSGPQSTTVETRGLALWTRTGVNHIVTLGYYQFGSGFGGASYAQLGVWSWDNSILTKKALYNWTTPGGSGAGAQGFEVATGDVDMDGTPDVVTIGQSSNGTVVSSQLRVWNWDGSSLNLKQTRDWISSGLAGLGRSVSIRDLNGDNTPEIIVVGQVYEYPLLKGDLTVWSDSTGSLTQLAQTSWQTSATQSSEEYARVIAGDVDADGAQEIVTAGYTNMPVGSTAVHYGVIRVWSWTGTSISLEKVYRLATSDSRFLAAGLGDLDGDGKQDLALGGQKVGKGFLDVRNAAYVYGSLAVGVDPAPASAGQSVTVSGSLTNETDGAALASTQILLEFSKDGGVYQIMATTTTDAQGRFGTSFTPTGPGSYTIRATWSGDEEHMGSTVTTMLTVNKATSVIILSTSSFNAKPGETLTVQGYLYPAASATITLTYTSPSGSVITHTVTPDSTGAFTDQVTVDSTGVWQVSASWPGSANNAGASSDAVRVQVQPEPIGLTLSMYGFVLALAALGVGVASMFRKGQRSTKPDDASWKSGPATSRPASTGVTVGSPADAPVTREPPTTGQTATSGPTGIPKDPEK